MSDLAFIPQSSRKEDGASRRSRSSQNRRSTRRRRSEDVETSSDFEQASESLRHFHVITSRSLDVIHENSESGDEDDLTPAAYFPAKSLSRTPTCSSLPNLSAFKQTLTDNDSPSAFSDTGDEWGFYVESEPVTSAVQTVSGRRIATIHNRK